MNIDQNHDLNQTQQFHRQYGANALLPNIDWTQIFKYSKLNDVQYQALETLYQSAVPLALQVFDELHFDVFEPYAYKPQGLGLFEKIAEQEDKLIQSLEAEARDLPAATRQQIWSMLLRGGAVLVFKAWLGKVKMKKIAWIPASSTSYLICYLSKPAHMSWHSVYMLTRLHRTITSS